ncbi:hypothetical protein G039_0315100 [Pseudomonas aeruginosa VRFPA01]|nr:hypothetical protein G039_0315100 [Pseudomonas aeruginosa VRFPA01]
MDAFRRHQQGIAGPGQAPFAAGDIAMPALQQQADVVLQVEVPGKGKAVVHGVDQAYAGNPAAEMGDLLHPATLPPTGRNDLG